MAEEWKRAEILLEEIKKDVKAIAEGHSGLNRKIDNFRSDVNGQFQDIQMVLKEHSNTLNEHSNTLNEIKHDLKEHIRQSVPPAHVSV